MRAVSVFEGPYTLGKYKEAFSAPHSLSCEWSLGRPFNLTRRRKLLSEYRKARDDFHRQWAQRLGGTIMIVAQH